MISALEYDFASRIKHVWVMGGNNYRFGPPLAVFHVFVAMPRVIEGPHGDVLRLHRPLVPAVHQTTARTCIYNIGIARIRYHITAFAPAHVVPVLAADVAIIGAAGNRYRGVVLLRTINVIEKLVVGGNVVKLGRRLVVLRRPACARIYADGGAAVVAVDHPLRIRRIDPKPMMIAMRRRQKFQSLAPISRAEQPGV